MQRSLSMLVKCGVGLCWTVGLVNALAAQDAMDASQVQSASNDDPFDVRSDIRLQTPRDLNDYFSFNVPDSIPNWENQKQILRQRLRFALGLLPAPTIDVIDPVIHGTQEYDGYQVSKVFFQSLPGFYVTGSLYRPLGNIADAPKRPGILCPHGHWANGRFVFMTDDEAKDALKTGAESMECAARSPLQARCVNLARMGCVVFHYDMIGYADSVQIPESVAHRFATQRLKLSGAKDFGLFSPAAEMHNNSVMALQTYNSIASLDFLESLVDVDPNRLAITGASGGGTQSFILSALDDRLAVSFPAVMVGTAMQGGCTCENCSNLRTFQGNVHFAAMFAPKPQGMTAADDWTVELETKGFPELQQLYSMYGKSENVHLTSRIEFGHNYNQVGRTAMYQWMAKHLMVKALPEREFTLLKSQDMTVWKTGLDDDKQVFNEWTQNQQPMPERKSGPAFEQNLLAWINKSRAANDASDWNANARAWNEVYFAERKYPSPNSAASDEDTRWQWVVANSETVEPNIFRKNWRLVHSGDRTTPVRIYQSENRSETTPELGGSVTLWIGNDSSELYDAEGNLLDWVRRRILAGNVIVQADLFGLGEFQRAAAFDSLPQWQKTSREFAGYVYGYNLPPAISRAQDVSDVLSALQSLAKEDECNLDVIATGNGAVALTLAAPVLAKQLNDETTKLRVGEIQVQLDGFRFSHVNSLLDPNFVPGVLNWGDVPNYWQIFAEQLDQEDNFGSIVIYDNRLSDWKAVVKSQSSIEVRASAVPR